MQDNFNEFICGWMKTTLQLVDAYMDSKIILRNSANLRFATQGFSENCIGL